MDSGMIDPYGGQELEATAEKWIAEWKKNGKSDEALRSVSGMLVDRVKLHLSVLSS